ncbi:TPA: DUF2787 domain-containing protein [Vibrio cholerae]|nr:DUF2787 domain-containing protein [Vibrio cholerae]
MQTLTFAPCQLPVSAKLHNLINQALQTCDAEEDEKQPSSLMLKFRDKSYSVKNGGYHPVEILIQKNQDGTWRFTNITELAYYGQDIVTNIDFNFEEANFKSFPLPRLSMEKEAYEAKCLYHLWEKNFCAYASMKVFDQIEVEFYGCSQ